MTEVLAALSSHQGWPTLSVRLSMVVVLTSVCAASFQVRHSTVPSALMLTMARWPLFTTSTASLPLAVTVWRLPTVASVAAVKFSHEICVALERQATTNSLAPFARASKS